LLTLESEGFLQVQVQHTQGWQNFGEKAPDFLETTEVDLQTTINEKRKYQLQLNLSKNRT
jgi:hypothetical protein